MAPQRHELAIGVCLSVHTLSLLVTNSDVNTEGVALLTEAFSVDSVRLT